MIFCIAIDKQKTLLSADVGHFSLVRAMHLADLITLMNGMYTLTTETVAFDMLRSSEKCDGLLTLASSQVLAVSCPSSPRYDTHLATPRILTTSGLLSSSCLSVCSSTFSTARLLDGGRRVVSWAKNWILLLIWYVSMRALSLNMVTNRNTVQISFGVAPAMVAFTLGFRSLADTVGLTFFVLCGLTRLARFNVTVSVLPKDASGKSQYFEGTPIPTSLGMDAIMAYWLSQRWVHDNLPFGVWFQGSAFEFHPAVILFMIHGCLMTSKTIRIPKP